MDARLGCKYCFKTLDPLQSDGDLDRFVKCRNCNAVYHEVCWRVIHNCLDCSGADVTTIDVVPPRPLPILGQRKPLHNEIYGQTVVQLDSGPPLTRIAIGLVTFVAIVTIIWRGLALVDREPLNGIPSNLGANQAQAADSPTAALNMTPLSAAKQSNPVDVDDANTTPSLSRTTPTPTIQMTPTPVAAKDPVADVTAENLNIRTGPGTEYAKVGVLPRGSRVFIIGQNDGWWQVRLEGGRTGWVSAKYAPAQGPTDQIPVASAPPTPTPEPTNTPGPTPEPVRIASTTDNRGGFTGAQEANGWSYLMEEGRNSGRFRQMPRFDGRCWRSDNWEPDMRICSDGEVHPGQSGRIAYQWRVSNSGQQRIDVHAHKIDTSCGDGVWVGTYRVADEQSGPRSLGDFQIGGGDNKGKTASYSEYFDQGNLLLVMVDVRGDSTCDMTRLFIDIR